MEVIRLKNPVFNENGEQVFTEAVFLNGREKVKPIKARIQAIKDLLSSEIAKHDKAWGKAKDKSRIKGFNPEAFWRNTLFKDLEDEIGRIFGFRSVVIEPFMERYLPADKVFESRVLNCIIWNSDRYPIDGLVTEDGFYDKTRSININIAVSLGLIYELNAEEILAVLLHEFGHGIDPALVDIKYTEVNILSKYITDRKGAINRSEQRYAADKIINKGENKEGKGFWPLVILPILTWLLTAFGTLISNIIPATKRSTQVKLEKVRRRVHADKDKFNRQNFGEAFADNFARMYGYGPQLVRGLQKLAKSIDDQANKRYKHERERQNVIVDMTISCIKDEHKTDLHRIKSLINEYQADINDPDTDPIVKKQLQEDLNELNQVLNEYLNNFSEFQNRVNQIIAKELDIIPVSPEETPETVAEGFEFYMEPDATYIEESRKEWEKIKRQMEAVTGEERGEFKRIFGHQECSLAKDKKGYYVRTHRCRSKSYENIADIPKKDVEFVSSTS